MKSLPRWKQWALLAARVAVLVLGVILGMRWHDHAYWFMAGTFVVIWGVTAMRARRIGRLHDSPGEPRSSDGV